MSRTQSNVDAVLTAAEIPPYLDRIGYRGGVEVSADTLRELHLAHMLKVPFENLDISRGDYILLELPRLFDKIVTRRRGGFCYELNGMFAALLRGLGFDVEFLSAGVHIADGQFSPEFDHMTLLVRLESDWLADVGFGDSFLAPVPFAGPDKGTEDPAGRFRIRRDTDRSELEKLVEGVWTPQYRFHLTPWRLGDFAERCHFQQTSPDSHFTQKSICSLARPDGRISLSERRLITTVKGERTEREVSGDDEYYSVLLGQFGIQLAPVATHSAEAPDRTIA